MEFNKLGACEGADDVTPRIKYATAHLKMSDGCRLQGSSADATAAGNNQPWRNGSEKYYQELMAPTFFHLMNFTDAGYFWTSNTSCDERWLIIDFYHANIRSSCLMSVCWQRETRKQWESRSPGEEKYPLMCFVGSKTETLPLMQVRKKHCSN